LIWHGLHLAMLKRSFTTREPDYNMKLSLPPHKDDHLIGKLDAPIFLVEYGDYQCPHSSKAHPWMLKLLKEYRGQLSYVYRHFLLVDIHPESVFASLAAESAGEMGKFWEMHEMIFSHFKKMSSHQIIHLAEDIGLDRDIFLNKMNQQQLMDRICDDNLTGEESGVRSTPAFFLNGLKIEGPISYEIIRSKIQNTLRGNPLSA
jgi:protein-disulfide isomerase